MKIKAKKETLVHLAVNPDLVMREEGKEALVFDPNTGSIKVLNYVGKLIWKLLDGKNSKADIEKKILKKFKDAKPQTVKKDLENFLKALESFGYVGKKI